jgi:hypothetical protein
MRTIRTPKKRRLMLEAVASGLSVTSAARRAGFSRRSVYDWKDADPTFAAELENAYEEATDRIADAAMQRALLPEHDALLIFMLKQRDPKRFNQKMVEVHVSGDPSNPVKVDHQHTLGRGRLLILPDNGRASLTETEIQQERERIAREHMVTGALIEGVAEGDGGADE